MKPAILVLLVGCALVCSWPQSNRQEETGVQEDGNWANVFAHSQSFKHKCLEWPCNGTSIIKVSAVEIRKETLSLQRTLHPPHSYSCNGI